MRLTKSDNHQIHYLEDGLSFAATELKVYCERIFGRAFDITAADLEVLPSGFHLATFANPDASQILQRFGVDRTGSAGMDEETYIRLIDDQHVYILGNRPRSVLYGVYDFLRDELGCEFAVSVDGIEHIPHLTSVELRPSQVMESAAFPVRGFGFHTDDNADTAHYAGMVDWLTKLKFNRIQLNIRLWQRMAEALEPMIRDRDLDLDLGIHSLGFFLPPAEYFETHPEWYADVDSRFGRQLKFSNLDSVSTVVENITAYLRETPGVRYLGLWPLDGTVFDPAEISSGRMGDIVLKYVNAVTAQVTEVFPDLIVDHLAYVGYVSPPRQERPHPKMMTSVCHYWDKNFTQPVYDAWYGRANNASEAAKAKAAKTFSPYRSHRQCCRDLNGWTEIGDTVVFTYYPDHNLSGQNVSNIWHVIRDEMRYYQALSVKGTVACYCMIDQYHLIYREIHAMAIYQWNPAADTDRRHGSLLRAVFADAWREVAAFYQSLDDLHNQPVFAGFRPADLLRGIIPTYQLAGYNTRLHDRVLAQFDERWQRSIAHLTCADEALEDSGEAKRYLGELRFNMMMQKMFFHLGCHVLAGFAYREAAAQSVLSIEQADRMAQTMFDKASSIFSAFTRDHRDQLDKAPSLQRKMNAYQSALAKDFPTMTPPF